MRVLALRAGLIVAVASLITTGSAGGQAVAPPTIITLVGSAKLPHGANAVVRLRPISAANPNIVIVDTAKVTPDDLAACLRAVNSIRAKYGASLTQEIMAIPKRHVANANESPGAISSRRALMQHHLDVLAKLGRTVKLSGVGKVKAADIVVQAGSH